MSSQSHSPELEGRGSDQWCESIGCVRNAFRTFLILVQIVLAIVLVVSLAGPPVSAKSLEEKKWLKVKTENFEIFSNQKEKKAVELAKNLEMFRRAVTVITNIESTESPIPTRIFVFRSRKGFREVGGNTDAAGLFVPGIRHNTIVMRESKASEVSVILHEYVHYLLRNRGGFIYPKWFDEGFAEYLSGIKERHDEFKIGYPHKIRSDWLVFGKWIPFKDILAPENMGRWRDEKMAMFYAQSWLLVHYLVNRPGRGGAFSREMNHYLELVESGSGRLESFEKAFNTSIEKFGSDVRKYYRKGLYRVYVFDSNKLSAGIYPEVMTLDKADAALNLANLASRLGEWDKAEEFYEVATADPDTRPRAEAGIGDLHKFRGNLDEARQFFERAVSLAPADPYCHLDMAGYWLARAENASDEFEFSESLSSARRSITAAWKIDESMPEIYALIGKTYSMEGRDYPKAIEMLEEAQYLLPANLYIRMMLAEVYAGAERTNEALKAARSVQAWSHKNSEASRKARELIAALELESEGASGNSR